MSTTICPMPKIEKGILSLNDFKAFCKGKGLYVVVKNDNPDIIMHVKVLRAEFFPMAEIANVQTVSYSYFPLTKTLFVRELA